MKIEAKSIAAFLDTLLNSSEFQDSSNNGLQVENSGRTGVVCFGVDASAEFLEKAHMMGAGMVVCHHGLSWDDSLKRITGLNYQKIAFLIRNDIALYASHLPLDAHAKYGNNALICGALGVKHLKPFGEYRGRHIGFEGMLGKPMGYELFKMKIRKKVAHDIRTMDFGKRKVQRVAVVSGGGSSAIDEAGQKGIDVFITGEPVLKAYHRSQEYGMNAVFAGHYATEVFGVRALAELVRRRFKVGTAFIDLKVAF